MLTLFTKKDRSEVEKLNDQIALLTGEVKKLREEKKAVSNAGRLQEEVNELKVEIIDLKIEKAKVTEDNDREKREVEHMVGLQRKRQEFENQAARRDAELKVREEALAAAHARFDEQMKFIEKRMETENTYVREMLGEVLGRLPTVTVDRSIEETYGNTERRERRAKEA